MNGVFHSLYITKAEAHEIHFLKTVKNKLSDCVLLGDRGYLSQNIQLNLFQTANIKLETPKRINQKDYKPQPYIFRKPIEKLFSQLCDQFNVSTLSIISVYLVKRRNNLYESIHLYRGIYK